MLTESQKNDLISKISSLVRESIKENAYFENLYQENQNKKSKEEEKEDEHSEENKNKKDIVFKWLDSSQQLHSVLAYKLWPLMKKSTARANFSKNYHGKDSNGNKYEFNSHEINKLYNLRNDFIQRSGLKLKG